MNFAKKSVIALMLAGSAFFVQAQDGAMKAQEGEVMALLGKTFTAFHQRDARAFASCYAEDAILISPMGAIYEGPAAIQGVHEQLFKMWGEPVPTKQEVKRQEIRFLSPRLAYVLYWNVEEAGNRPRDEKVFSMLIEKEKGQWAIRHVQMTPVMDMGQAMGSN